MLAVNWATNIWKNELNEPQNLSVPSLIAYYRNNVNDLNNILGTCFSLNTTQGVNYLELTQSLNTQYLIDDEAANVYKYLFLVSYYGRMIRTFTGCGDINLLVQASSDQGTLRFVDRGNLAKVYLQLRKDTETTLKNLVNKYKIRNQTAVDVQGDDQYVRNPGEYLEGISGGVLYQQDII